MVAALCSAPAFADQDWKRPSVIEGVPMVLTVGLVWADVLQTRDALHLCPGINCRYEENFLLGKHPSDAKLILLGGVLPTLILTAVWYFLPSPQRDIFIAAPLMIEGETVWENASKGLTIRF